MSAIPLGGSCSILKLLLVFQYLFLATQVFGTLELFTAGVSTGLVRQLESVDKICADDFASTGFNIRCIGESSDKEAEFYINGALEKREGRSPFFIGGDKFGVPYKWKRAPSSGTLTIECRQSSGSSISVLTFTCDSSQASPSPHSSTSSNPPLRPARMYFVLADEKTPALLSRRIQLKSHTKFCPQRDIGYTNISILCASDGNPSTTASIWINRDAVQKDLSNPFLISGQVPGSAGIPIPWTNIPKRPFRATCRLSSGISKKVRKVLVACPQSSPVASPLPSRTVSPRPSKSPIFTPTPSATSPSTSAASRISPPIPSVSPTSDNEKDRAGCVIIDVRSATPSNGWVRVSNGLAFQPNNMATSITGSSKAQLFFSFRPLQTSRHAVVVDMTTSAGSDFNDVWIHLKGGFQLMRQGIAQNVTGWTKGYHNKRGRAALISHVDRNAHSIASAEILDKDVEYLFGLGGRSNKVTVHQILLFPCAGTGCQRGGWKDTQNTCLPGSL